MLADEWQSRLSACAFQLTWPNRVFVLNSCESTQDEASTRFNDLKNELAVFALQQTKGRGRLGRTWEQQSTTTPSPLGVAVTFALSAQHHDPTWLPIRAAVAAKSACEDVVSYNLREANKKLLLKWPNDLVTPEGSKLGGILVEKPANTNALLLGIGINVAHTQSDLPTAFPATSLSLIAQQPLSTLDVAVCLIRQLHTWLTADTTSVEQTWKAADALSGTTQTLQYNNHTYSGKILDISPTTHLTIETDTGIITLPAATTSILKR